MCQKLIAYQRLHRTVSNNRTGISTLADTHFTGGFNWGLHFRWDQIPHDQLQTKDDYTKPVKYV